MKMNTKELIEALSEDFQEDNNLIDNACFKRLIRLSYENGEKGEISCSLLNIVKKIVEI